MPFNSVAGFVPVEEYTVDESATLCFDCEAEGRKRDIMTEPSALGLSEAV